MKESEVGKKICGLRGFNCPKSGRNEPFDFCWKTK